jgi:adenine-specific DNA methylase
MGSKRAMLTNGLGKAIDQEIADADRFIDLFLGTGEVASFVARKYPISVFGVDLQAYSVFLTEAVVARNCQLQWLDICERWIARARVSVERRVPPVLIATDRLTRRIVSKMRTWSEKQEFLPITKAYGGHYFSPYQSVWIDALRATLPKDEPSKTVAIAALIRASSQCVASPGHTAQPFQPTRTAVRFLKEAWIRDPVSRVVSLFGGISNQFALKTGAARIADAGEIAANLSPGDLAFLDPPYSGVQYSRFYHVLESIARGRCGEVEGIGRYPAPKRRPTSNFSLTTESEAALNQLLFLVSTSGAKAILTFPDHECSNGLSGELVRQIAKAHFRVKESRIKSKFSTLGGRGKGSNKVARRKARHDADELLLILHPR